MAPRNDNGVPPARSRAARGRRTVLGLVTVGTAVAVLAGLLLASARSRDDALAAVRQAVDALLVTPAVRMRTTSPDGTTRADLRVTGTGETVGDLVVDGRRYEFLAVAGRQWLRSVDGRLPGPVGAGSDPSSDALAAEVLAGRWVAVDLDALHPGLRLPPPPATVGMRVRSAIATDPDAVELDRDGPPVGGTPTIVAHTPAGDVHVSRAAPHRVLRIAPGLTRGYALGTPTPGPAPALVAFRQDGGTSLPPTAAEKADLDLTDLGPDGARQVYDDVERRIPDLADAADASLQLSIAARPLLTCGPEGCRVRVSVLARVQTSGPVTTEEARATLSVDVAIEGRAAGSCRTEVRLVLGTPTPIECRVPAAGPVFTAVDAEKRSAAVAATAPGGTARWTVAMTGVAVVVGRADVHVDEIRQDVENSREDLLCLDPTACPDPPAGGPYTGHLIPVDNDDEDARLLAVRLNGTPSVYFENDPNHNEIDAVNDEYIAETKKATVQRNPDVRNQAKVRFDAARQTGRAVYYHFEGGPPRPEVRKALEGYAVRYGVRLVIDTTPLR